MAHMGGIACLTENRRLYGSCKKINKLVSDPNLRDSQLDCQHLVVDQTVMCLWAARTQIVALRLGSLLMACITHVRQFT